MAAFAPRRQHDARAATGDDALTLAVRADALRVRGAVDDAIRLFDAAVARDPTLVAAWYGRALAHETSGALAMAQADYARVTALAPETAPGFAGLAAVESALGQVAAARAHATHALRLAPDDVRSGLTLARCALSEGDAAAAVTRLRDLLARGAGRDAAVAYGLLGDALDALGEVDAAFAAYARAKATGPAGFGAAGASPALAAVARIDAAVAALPAFPVRPVPPVAGEAATHVFLLGYPRSGTTLVEQVLATVPGVTSLEEAPTLAAAAPLLDALPALATLADAEVARLRADYWGRVAAAGAGGATFVDMDPFKGPALPLIARLFPAAKVVVVRRDPRDVVWSCFRRGFVAGPVTAEFTDPVRTARHYAATMRLVDRCVRNLPLTTHTLRYEALVDDFDATTQALCAFTGVPWSPALRDFAATARRGRVRTASAAQVRSPLFDGRGQWRPYAKYLAPALPLLAPWVSAESTTAG